ncbi:putative ribosomal protein L36e [Rosellinia necatrix]|uniref:Putative ribosomal protein L36e n=1 Tax=Rosellinia necatrix TaxID=77044 RepID=A0A1S7UP53_ROSNE|nr:putative ribosomal protein L36e [Rosellinia necatrix]
MPPGDVIPEFDHPSNGTAGVIALCIISLALTLFFVLLYTCGRVFVVKRFHISDAIAFASFVRLYWRKGGKSGLLSNTAAFFQGLYIGLLYVNLHASITMGYFVHQWDIRISSFGDFLLDYIYATVFYQLTIMLSKAAILLQWIRIFVPTGTRNRFFRLCSGIIVVDVLFYVAAELIIIIPCAPFAEHVEKLGICSSGSQAQYIDFTSATINLLLDLTIFAAPQTVIWRLHMSRTKRLNVSLIFTIGTIACAAAVGRLVATIYFYRVPQVYRDSTYLASYVGVVTLIEATSGILIFCFPGVPKGLQAIRNAKQSIYRLRFRLSSKESSFADDIDHLPLTQHASLRTNESNGHACDLTPTQYRAASNMS